MTAQHALRLRPDLDIVARVHWRDEGRTPTGTGGRGGRVAADGAGLEILRLSLYRYRKPRDEVDEFVGLLREHLSFTLTEDVEDLLPPEGIGPAPELPAPGPPAPKANEAPEPDRVAEEPAPQSSDDS